MGAGRVHPRVRRPAAARRPTWRPARAPARVHRRLGRLRRGLVPRRCRADRVVAHHSPRDPGHRRGHRRSVRTVPAHRQLPRWAPAQQGGGLVCRDRRHRRQRGHAGRWRRRPVGVLARRVLHQPPLGHCDGRPGAPLPACRRPRAWPLRRRRRPRRHPRQSDPWCSGCIESVEQGWAAPPSWAHSGMSAVALRRARHARATGRSAHHAAAPVRRPSPLGRLRRPRPVPRAR